ncbi:hypothetical protein LNV23_07890 [Paucibacter sp. DJ1R-11]|uniref:hypothetical protein n=1 Tax=Paucibacter sp. DJ1R-11 TaxID=2893556 RepID=UPI0021E4BB64|nr:hypothetical protein [Paucibacter sp. DJ1R-11]MCV2363368.1 hypothetical protein [Paucibacter sp. DJ1R-11]
MNPDALLLKALDDALRAGDDADAALARVGLVPWLDSRRPEQARALAGADLTPDPEAPHDCTPVQGAAAVLYWGLAAGSDKAAPIAGLVWPLTGGPARLLRALVMPP